MTAEQAAWVTAKERQLNDRMQAYHPALQSLVEAPYVQNVLQKLPLLEKVKADFAGFQAKINVLLSTLPAVEGVKANSFSRYIDELSGLKEFVRETYGMVPKGYYKRQFVVIGIALGICFGLLFKKLFIGVFFGILLGLMIGTGKDKKAEKENRVL